MARHGGGGLTSREEPTNRVERVKWTPKNKENQPTQHKQTGRMPRLLGDGAGNVSAIASEARGGDDYLNSSEDTVSRETRGTGNNKKQPASARGEKMKGVVQ